MICALVIGASLYFLKNRGGESLTGRVRSTITIAASGLQPTNALLDLEFKDILRFVVINPQSVHYSVSSFKIKVDKFNGDSQQNAHSLLCTEVQLVRSQAGRDVVISNIINLGSDSEKTISVLENLRDTTGVQETYKLQARYKQDCINRTITDIIPSFYERDIAISSQGADILREVDALSHVIGNSHHLLFTETLSVNSPQQPRAASLPPGLIPQEVLKVTVSPSVAMDINTVTLKLISDNAEQKAFLLRRLALAIFYVDEDGHERRVSGTARYFDGSEEKAFDLENADFSPGHCPCTLSVKVMHATGDGQQFRIETRDFGIDRRRFDAHFIGNKVVRSNQFTLSSAAQVPPAGNGQPEPEEEPDAPPPPPAPPVLVPGTFRVLPSAGPAIFNIQDQNPIKEIFKFNLDTNPDNNIKNITFTLKADETSVAADQLIYMLFDADTNTSINASPTINAAAKTVSFKFSPPEGMPCEPANTAFCRTRRPLLTGKNLSLRVMPNVNFRQYIIGRTVNIGFFDATAFTVHGENVTVTRGQQRFPMWGGTKYTFSNTAETPDEDEVQQGPPPDMRRCAADNLCSFPLTPDEIPEHTYPATGAEPHSVIGFSLPADPRHSAVIAEVKVRIDQTVLEPVPESRLKAELVTVDAQGVEHARMNVQGRPIAPTQAANGFFTFRGISLALNRDRPLHLRVRVHVEEDPDVSVVQNFKLSIYGNDIRLNQFHSVNFPQGFSSNLMSVAASVIAPSEECSEDHHFDELTQQCVANVVFDACPNTAEIEAEVPGDMELDGQGQCVMKAAEEPEIPPTDVCVNMPDVQLTVPRDRVADANGNCTVIVVTPEETVSCTSLGKFDYTGPARSDIPRSSCIPCPTALYISSNKTCVEPEEEKTPVKKDAIKEDKKVVVGDSGKKTDTTNLRGSAFDDLSDSPRLIRAPERGNTGPAAAIYVVLGGLSPAAVYMLRKLRK